MQSKKSLSLSLKLTIAVLVNFLLLGIVISVFSVYETQKGLKAATYAQLTAVREAQKSQLNQYLDLISKTLGTIATQEGTVMAYEEFLDGFEMIVDSVEFSDDNIKKSLIKMYDEEYLNKVNYEALNGAKRRSTEDYLPKSKNGRILHYLYILKNTEPVGEKNKYYKSDVLNTYNSAHVNYHNSFNELLNRFGLYDVFMIDLKGNVIYTVFKEKDYATNLENGVYADSGLGEVYRKSKNLKKGEIAFSDFKPYEPSYNLPATFIGTKIFIKDEHVGYMVFQLPYEHIDSIINFDNNYAPVGMGETGHSYLVGADKYFRNNSRFIKDIKDENVKISGTTFSTLFADTESVKDALNGLSGERTLINYLGQKVLSSYSILDVFDTKWAIIVEKGYDEALETAVSLRNLIVLVTALFTLIAVVSTILANNNIVVKKIKNLSALTQNIATGEGDLTQRIPSVSNDEIGVLSDYINKFIENVHSIVKDVQISAQFVAEGTSRLAVTTDSLSGTFSEQAGNVNSVASAMEELNATSFEITSSCMSALEKSHESSDITEQGRKKVEESVKKIQEIMDQTQLLGKTIARLSESSGQISDILNVIDDIADQTNLLALNAAIEAARAGEAGRGFAVVADEVRKLAERTQKATGEITGIISDFKSETESASKNMISAEKSVKEGVSVMNSTRELFDNIVSSVSDIESANSSINNAINEQVDTINMVTSEIQGLSASVEESSLSITEVSNTLSEQEHQAENLKNLVNRFKV